MLLIYQQLLNQSIISFLNSIIDLNLLNVYNQQHHQHKKTMITVSAQELLNLSQRRTSPTHQPEKHLDMPNEDLELESSQKYSRKRKMISRKDLRLALSFKLKNKKNLLHFQNKFMPDPPSFHSSNEAHKQRTTKQADFERFLRRQTDSLDCPVCRLEIIQPATTPCGHTFCLECIQASLLQSNNCPMCRKPISSQDSYGVGSSTGVHNLINKINQGKKNFDNKNRRSEYEGWKKRRFVSQEEIINQKDVKLDVWTYEAKWQSARVLEMYSNEKGKLEEVLVQLQTYGKNQNEVVEFNTLRVARHGFYSLQKEKNINTYQIGNLPSFIRGLQNSQEGRSFILRPSNVFSRVEPLNLRRVESISMEEEELESNSYLNHEPIEFEDSFEPQSLSIFSVQSDFKHEDRTFDP